MLRKSNIFDGLPVPEIPIKEHIAPIVMFLKRYCILAFPVTNARNTLNLHRTVGVFGADDSCRIASITTPYKTERER